MMGKGLRVGILAFLIYMLGLAGIVAACGAMLRLAAARG